MKKTATTICIYLLTILSVNSQVFIGENSYTASCLDSKTDSRTVCMLKAKDILLKKIIIKFDLNNFSNSKTSKRDIINILSSITELEILDEDWDDNSLDIDVKIEVDSINICSQVELILKNELKYNRIKEYNKNILGANLKISKISENLLYDDDISSKISGDHRNAINKIQIKEYLDKANYSIGQELFKIAIDSYKKIIKIRPNSSIIYFEIGEIYFEIENYKQAIKNYKQAVVIKSDFINAYFKMATSYEYLENYNSAITNYKKVIKYDRRHIRAYYFLGTLYSYLNNKNGITYYQKAARLGDKLSQSLLEDRNETW